MNCLHCNRIFKKVHHNQKICNDECKLNRERKRNNAFYSKNRDKRLKECKERQSTDEYKKNKREYDKKYRLKNIDKISIKHKYERDIIYYGGNREKALMRDKNKCVRCGNTNQLIVHHIDHSGTGKGMNRKKAKLANNNLLNLETLCRSCHMKEHNPKRNYN